MLVGLNKIIGYCGFQLSGVSSSYFPPKFSCGTLQNITRTTHNLSFHSDEGLTLEKSAALSLRGVDLSTCLVFLFPTDAAPQFL